MSRAGSAHVFARECAAAEYPTKRGLPPSRGTRTRPRRVRRLFPLSLLVDAADRLCETRAGRIPASAQDRCAPCRFAVDSACPTGSASHACGSRTGFRDGKEQRHREAEETDKRDKEARGADNTRSPGAPCETATNSTKSVLGLCLVVPVIRFSPLVLILAPPNRTPTNRVLPLSRHICATASAALHWKVARR